MPSYDQNAPSRSTGGGVNTESTPIGEARGEWVSVRAIAWVLDDAPCPAKLLPVLTAIARRCDEHGRGSRQSTATIAEKAGKSRKQAQRDIVKLRELKLIEEGDQTLVAHMPKHLRPTVYDVAMHIKGSKPVDEGRNPTGHRKVTTGVDSDTPSLPREGVPSKGCPPTQGTPPNPLEGTTPIPSKGEGGSLPRDTEQAFEEALEQPVEQSSLSSGCDRDSLPAPVEADGRERDDEEDFQEDELSPANAEARELIAKHCGITDAGLAEQIIGGVEDAYQVRTIGFWHNAVRNGSIHTRVNEALQNIRAAIQDEQGRRGHGPQSPADALAAKYDRLDGTNATGTNPDGQRQDPFFAGPWINMADGGRVQHGYPSQRASNGRAPYRPWRDPHPSEYDQPL